MKKQPVTSAQKTLVKELNVQLVKLRDELTQTQKADEMNSYLIVKQKKSRSHFERIKVIDGPDKGIGHYSMLLDITAKKETIVIPLSIASGKKVTGFMYQIEGTSEGSVSKAEVEAKGDGITQVTIGTLVYAKIPVGKTATLRINVEIRGKIGKAYTFIVYRINYKLEVTDARYKQYTKEIHSDTLKFS